MTIEETEFKLIQEIDVFNKNIEWWSSEFEKTSVELQKAQESDSLGINQKKIDKLVAKMNYLVGKSKVEQKCSENIDRKLYNLFLSKELLQIQGTFEHSRKSRQKKQ